MDLSSGESSDPTSPVDVLTGSVQKDVTQNPPSARHTPPSPKAPGPTVTNPPDSKVSPETFFVEEDEDEVREKEPVAPENVSSASLPGQNPEDKTDSGSVEVIPNLSPSSNSSDDEITLRDIKTRLANEKRDQRRVNLKKKTQAASTSQPTSKKKKKAVCT
jgi:hypothetical protein